MKKKVMDEVCVRLAVHRFAKNLGAISKFLAPK